MAVYMKKDGRIVDLTGVPKPVVVQNPTGITIGDVPLQYASAAQNGLMTKETVQTLVNKADQAIVTKIDGRVSALETSQRGQDTKLDTLQRNADMLGEEQTITAVKHYVKGAVVSGYDDGLVNVRAVSTLIVNAIPVNHYNGKPGLIYRATSFIGRGGYYGSTLDNPNPVYDQCVIIGQNAFTRSPNIESFTNKSDLFDIGLNAFDGCTTLKKIDLKKAKTIASGAMKGCTMLTEFIIREANNDMRICTLASADVFSGAPVTIYVPDELVDQYKGATNWIAYASQIKGLSELPAEASE